MKNKTEAKEPMEKEPLIHTVRDPETMEKIGVLYAFDPEHIGWAMKSRRDTWNKELGIQIAKGRAMMGLRNNVPDRIFKGFCYFVGRAYVYFKEESK